MGPARLASQRVTCERARRQVRGERQRDFPSTTSLDRHLVGRRTRGVQRIRQVHRPADPVRDVGGLGGELRHGHALLLQHQEARALGLDLLQGSRGLPGGRREGEHGEKSLLLPASIHYDVANLRIYPLHCFSHVIQGQKNPAQNDCQLCVEAKVNCVQDLDKCTACLPLSLPPPAFLLASQLLLARKASTNQEAAMAS